MNKKIFIIWWWVDASNYKNFEEYLLSEEFNPYEEKVKRWKDNLQNDLWIWFEVIKIPMPNKWFANYEYWKIVFEKAIPYFEEENILIWHSLGGSFILKYLEENDLKNISEIHLIAPASFDTPEEKLWSFSFDTSLENFKKYENITNFYFSKDDEVVPFWEYEKLTKILPNAKYNIFEDAGHFRMEHFNELVNNIKWKKYKTVKINSINLFSKWNDLKIKIDKKNTDNIFFKEWDIWWTSLWQNIKSESNWKWDNFRRPLLVFKKLSNDSCIAIPLSSKEKNWSWFSTYNLHWEKNTALLYQIRMIHKNRFQRKIWELDEKDFLEIKKRLKNLLNL